MKTFCRSCLTLLLSCAALPAAQNREVELALKGIRQIAEGGRYEHALRAIDMGLARYPDDPQLLAYRANVTEQLARDRGKPTLLASSSHPAAPTRRDPVPGQDFTVANAEIAMLWIAPGTLLMSDPMGSDNDTRVTLSQGYWLGRTEVTQEQWQTLMEHLPSPSYFKGSDRPVERIQWISAVEFCRKLTERERADGRLPAAYEYTLPTEAQWEFACRAGTTGPHAGNLEDLAWFGGNSGQQTHPVAQKRPNAWGLYDMHGNVSEWCADGYNGYPGGEVTDLFLAYDGPSAATHRILRGGAWPNSAGQCRSSHRFWQTLNYLTPGTGFRVALAPVRQPTASIPRAGSE